MFCPSIKVAAPETPSAAAFKRRRADDESQWGIRSDVTCPEYKAKDPELTARDGSEYVSAELA